MIAYRDFDGSWRLSGFEEFSFSSEEDAMSAAEFGIAFTSEQAVMEWRYRRAAERAKSVGSQP